MKKTQKHSEKLDSAVQEDNEDIEFEEIETCLNKNNSNRAYQLVRQLTSENRIETQLSRTSLGNVLKKNAPTPTFPNKIYIRFFVRKLRWQ